MIGFGPDEMVKFLFPLMNNNTLLKLFTGIVIGLLLLTAANGQIQAQGDGSLTVADYIEIQQLVNRLNFALDYCGNGGRDFADLFVEGGRFIIDNGDGAPIVKSTREDLMALAGGPDCESRKTPPSAYILHLAESLVIEPALDGARGISYAIYPSSQGRRFSNEVAGQLGIYHDEFVRTSQGWRFRTRRHEINPAPGETGLSHRTTNIKLE